MLGETLRQQLDGRVQTLLRERANWEDDWRAIGENFFPVKPRFGRKDFNRRGRINGAVINSTPVVDLRVLSSGLMSGMTSPSRKWFGLTTGDPDLVERPEVSRYLFLVEKRIEWAFSRSNLYAVLSDHIYPGIGSYGTAVAFLEEDFASTIRLDHSPIGDWALAVGPDGVVDTIARELPLTVRNLVGKFGKDACSQSVKTDWERGSYDRIYWVRHIVAPNEEYQPGRGDARGKRFASYWWEETAPLSEGDGGFLRVAGFEEFPALCTRWSTAVDDVYGVGPGFAARGDASALQHLEKRLAKQVDKLTDPPLVGPEELQNRRVSLLPGDVTYVPRGSVGKLEPVQIIQPGALAALLKHVERHEDRIDQAFYTNLWLALLNDDRRQRATATEVEWTRQEVMLQLGPLLERQNLDLLEPLIVRTYSILGRMGLLPRPPRELAGAEIKIEFMSVLHQVQKLTALSGVRTLLSEVGNLVQLGRTDALDTLNVDEIVNEIASMTGIKPELILSKDEVAAIRKARADRLSQQQNAQTAVAASQAAKNVGSIPGESLGDIGRYLSPMAAAQGGIPQGAGA